MSIETNNLEGDIFREVVVDGVRFRVSADGRTISEQTVNGWHELEQIGDKWGKGYLRVKPRGLKQTITVHKLVALAWHGAQPDGKPIVEHLDGSRQRNHYANVRWATFKDNMNSALRLGERDRKYPVKLDPATVYAIRKHRTRAEVAAIADETGTGEQTIRDVFDRRTWRNVRDDQPFLF